MTGQLALIGASFLSVGTFRADLLPGGRIEGVLVDGEGRSVATMSAKVSGWGVRGRFEAQNGETGEWSWQAPFPRQWAEFHKRAGDEEESANQ
jgi:hypothetical protein